MFVKAACLIVNSISYHHCNVPPPSSKTVSAETDKIRSEGWNKMQAHLWIPYLMSYIHNFGTLIYVLTLLRGGFIGEFDVNKELGILENWQAITLIVSVSGHALRVWAIQSLANFFTFQLTIRKGHKLIGHGPYTYLRHPAYTGLLINKVAAVTLLFHHGLWDIIVAWATVLTRHIVHAGIPVISEVASWTPVSPTSTWTGLLGYPADVWFCAAFYFFVFKIITVRIPGEEKMLAEHFRNEWEGYASKRWRLVPFVY
ncbi:hypothetical protein BGZ59_005365 [Podila verticillata]|nr:hypothetical protein BGZ59_005365 [Podila verticillata]